MFIIFCFSSQKYDRLSDFLCFKINFIKIFGLFVVVLQQEKQLTTVRIHNFKNQSFRLINNRGDFCWSNFFSFFFFFFLLSIRLRTYSVKPEQVLYWLLFNIFALSRFNRQRKSFAIIQFNTAAVVWFCCYFSYFIFWFLINHKRITKRRS